MKKFFYVALMCFASVALFSACEGNNPDKGGKKVDYDKMIGEWKLTSYSAVWTNLDDNKEEKNLSFNNGFLNITKKADAEGDMYYYYKENFAAADRAEFEGRIELDPTNNVISLRKEDGFLRNDMDGDYEYTVSFPADGKMEWTYSWQGSHGDGSVSHTCKRNVKIVFTK